MSVYHLEQPKKYQPSLGCLVLERYRYQIVNNDNLTTFDHIKSRHSNIVPVLSNYEFHS